MKNEEFKVKMQSALRRGEELRFSSPNMPCEKGVSHLQYAGFD